MARILVVDDEVGIRELLSEILADEGHDVTVAENAGAARAARAQMRPDLVLLDVWMPDMDGITLLKEWAGSGQLTMPVVIMSGHGTIDTAVEATRIGALDYLEKPIALQKLLATVRNALRHVQTMPAGALTLAALPRSVVVRDLRRRLEQLASASKVLMLREPAGGIAELCARTLVKPGAAWLDLSTLAEPLTQDQLRRLRSGVAFVPDLARLTRLQQKNLFFALDLVEPTGVYLVCAASATDAQLHAVGLDSNMLHRLAPVWLTLPALDEFREDLPDLAAQLLVHLADADEAPRRRLSGGAGIALRSRLWPGDFAQFRASVRSAALTALGDEITAEEMARVLGETAVQATLPLPLDQPLREAREAFERLYFEHHLRLESGNMTRVAEKTGIERTHLYRKLRQLGLHGSKGGDS